MELPDWYFHEAVLANRIGSDCIACFPSMYIFGKLYL